MDIKINSSFDSLPLFSSSILSFYALKIIAGSYHNKLILKSIYPRDICIMFLWQNILCKSSVGKSWNYWEYPNHKSRSNYISAIPIFSSLFEKKSKKLIRSCFKITSNVCYRVKLSPSPPSSMYILNSI